MSLDIRKMPLGHHRIPLRRLAWAVTALLLLLVTATAAEHSETHAPSPRVSTGSLAHGWKQVTQAAHSTLRPEVNRRVSPRSVLCVQCRFEPRDVSVWADRFLSRKSLRPGSASGPRDKDRE